MAYNSPVKKPGFGLKSTFSLNDNFNYHAWHYSEWDFQDQKLVSNSNHTKLIMKTQLKDNGLKQIESLMREHIDTKNLRDGVWRAFATQKVPLRDQLRARYTAELYTDLETNAERNNSIFSFLATTDTKERIVGKEQES